MDEKEVQISDNTLENIKQQLEESKHEVLEDELESFRPTPVSSMTRSERRSRTKYFKKLFKEHLKRKPSVNIEEEDEERQQAAIMRLQRWATRYAILANKIQELEFKGNYTRGDEQEPEEDEALERAEREIGAE